MASETWEQITWLPVICNQQTTLTPDGLDHDVQILAMHHK